MSDPTPTPTTPPVSAKSARETIREAVGEAVKWFDPIPLESVSQRAIGYGIARSALALRALLDAPKGGVGRVIEAAESMVSAEEQYCVGTETTLEGAVLVHAGNAKRVYQAAIALRAALAALRASPESVGGAGVSLADDLRKARDAARIKHLSEALQHEAKCAEEASAEVQRLKADLAAARGEVERVTKERDTDRAQLDALYPARKIVRDGYGTITSWRTTLRPNGDVEAAVAPPTPAYAAADLTQIARMDRIEARVAAVEKTATPPVTEAPISERIGPYAVDEVRVHPDGVFMVTLVGELEAVRSAGARLFEQVWLVADSAAAERAAKAPQAEG